MVEEIIKDIDILRDVSKVEDCVSNEEGTLLAQEMFKALAGQKTAPAIAANQIGIQKRIIALSVREPVYLINPVIVSATVPVPYIESHASFPQKLFTPIRFASIVVTADNLEGEFNFGLKGNQRNLLFKDGKINPSVLTHPVIMEAMYIQQAVDTLNGVMPVDREAKMIEPVNVDKGPARNEIVTLTKDDAEMKIKFKKATKFIQDGWKIK